ncbi:hypothetical protein BAUCODRAFT_31287 [Baudoinia panamericana UAMH 10762]|uniref:Secreted protein n=1 Tax=Baudoinia panamericana (strain UAMH 10762) TaxID=717646 RepID=M2MQF8_BAUPA|nr:uncharacterized protein BAUCODRAFT_31287 [Baudoinia panamericana UAMH 10762]EMC99006.1 hypothetical protein BAUCODRAFT_31287 [Baudoinia panamericana UAMH 10762]
MASRRLWLLLVALRCLRMEQIERLERSADGQCRSDELKYLRNGIAGQIVGAGMPLRCTKSHQEPASVTKGEVLTMLAPKAQPWRCIHMV